MKLSEREKVTLRVILQSPDTWLNRTVPPFRDLCRLNCNAWVFEIPYLHSSFLCFRIFFALFLLLPKSSSCILFLLAFPFCISTASFSFDLLVPSLAACANMSTNPPTPRVIPKDLYVWASRELLDECSSLLSAKALREHVGTRVPMIIVPSQRGMMTISPCSLAP